MSIILFRISLRIIDTSMQYFRNAELAKLYHVHQSTVANWIEAATSGKLKLTLHEHGGRRYIANTASNIATIEKLVAERKKFVNSGGHKLIRPGAQFYKNYTREQIADIISNLTTYREVPVQYSYIGGGASYWDEYAWRLVDQDRGTIKNTIQLLDSNLGSLDRLIGNRKRVNVVDLGVGNALPIQGILQYLVERGILGRYIAIDVSAQMLEIAERNIKQWFGDSVIFEGYQRDMTCERFKDLLVDDYLAGGADESINLVFLLGGTLLNFRNPDDVLRIINNSMMPGDLLIHCVKLDTPQSRRYFDFSNVRLGEDKPPSQYTYMLEQLNIDQSCYELEAYFDEELKARFLKARLKVALTIEFDLGDALRRVELGKNEHITLLRIWHRDVWGAINQFMKNGFGLLQASQTSNHEYLLTISDLRGVR